MSADRQIHPIWVQLPLWAGNLIILALAIVVIAEKNTPPEPPLPYPENPIQIGTNTPALGAHIWTPVNRSYLGLVKAQDPAHTFPDGTTRPAIQIYRDRTLQWLPCNRLSHLVQHP